MDKILAITTKRTQTKPLAGIEVLDPSYQLPGFWIENQHKEKAEESGYVLCEALTVLTTHLQENLQHYLAELLTRKELENLLAQQGIRNLCDELVPAVLSLSQVQKVLQNLLRERVSIRHLEIIFESLLEYGKQTTDPDLLTELIRSRLAAAICQKLMGNQEHLPVLTLSPTLEQTLRQNLTDNYLALEPTLTEQLLRSLSLQVEKMLADRKRPVLLCAPVLRRQIKQLTQRLIPHLTVLAMSEIPVQIHIESYAVIK